MGALPVMAGAGLAASGGVAAGALGQSPNISVAQNPLLEEFCDASKFPCPNGARRLFLYPSCAVVGTWNLVEF